MSNIQIRIDKSTKNSAKKVFEEIGLDMTTGIKLYLNQVIITKSIPFKLVTKNGFTFEEEEKLLNVKKEAEKGKNITEAMNRKEAIKYLKSL